MEAIQIGKVKFWGILKGRVSLDEVERISAPLDSILHLLRHFDQVPESWAQKMIANGFTTREFVEDQLKMAGSKWNSKVNLLIPEDIIRFSQGLLRNALRSDQELKWIGRGMIDFCYLNHTVSLEEKKQLLGCENNVPMGKMGLISLEKVPNHVKVKQHFNRGGIVNVVEMDLLETDEVVITLARKETGIIQVYSTFPGILTPPIPRDSQAPDEQKYNRAFWSQYALIEPNSAKKEV